MRKSPFDEIFCSTQRTNQFYSLFYTLENDHGLIFIAVYVSLQHSTTQVNCRYYLYLVGHQSVLVEFNDYGFGENSIELMQSNCIESTATKKPQGINTNTLNIIKAEEHRLVLVMTSIRFLNWIFI